jgi:hypothetical protein
MLSFGIKEAERAEEFAKTKEQKETVLAVVRMMNIPITVQKQASKKAKKLEAKIGVQNQVVNKLEGKVSVARTLTSKHVSEKQAIATVSVNWAL